MRETTPKNLWFTPVAGSANAKLRLFCLPYAGGSPLIYRGWQNLFPDSIEICAVNLPGRGNRLSEKPYTDMMSLARAVKDGLLQFFDRPFAFMGHSMGGILSFEITRLLRRLGMPLPVKLFISGCGAPQVPSHERRVYDLPESELIEELRRLNGTPPEVLNNRELLSILLPVIRADFSVCQTYIYTEEAPLDIPIIVLRGTADTDIIEDTAIAWKDQTTNDFIYSTLPGDHFFCHTEKDRIIEIISGELLPYTSYGGY